VAPQWGESAAAAFDTLQQQQQQQQQQGHEQQVDVLQVTFISHRKLYHKL
jgi:hypothetical protein